MNKYYEGANVKGYEGTACDSDTPLRKCYWNADIEFENFKVSFTDDGKITIIASSNKSIEITSQELERILTLSRNLFNHKQARLNEQEEYRLMRIEELKTGLNELSKKNDKK